MCAQFTNWPPNRKFSNFARRFASWQKGQIIFRFSKVVSDFAHLAWISSDCPAKLRTPLALYFLFSSCLFGSFFASQYLFLPGLEYCFPLLRMLCSVVPGYSRFRIGFIFSFGHSWVGGFCLFCWEERPRGECLASLHLMSAGASFSVLSERCFCQHWLCWMRSGIW